MKYAGNKCSHSQPSWIVIITVTSIRYVEVAQLFSRNIARVFPSLCIPLPVSFYPHIIRNSCLCILNLSTYMYVRVCVCVCVFRYASLWFHKFSLQKRVYVLLDYRRHIFYKRQKFAVLTFMQISSDRDMYVVAYAYDCHKTRVY